jgi:hypothetical protein
VILVDDHLLLRTLTGTAPTGLTGEHIGTTTGWWWRAVAPIAYPPRPGAGQHSRFFAGLSRPEADVLWEALCRVGQADSHIHVAELVPLGPAMAWLARHEGLNRLAAEAVAVAMDLGAAIYVRAGNEGRLPEITARYGIDLHIADRA